MPRFRLYEALLKESELIFYQDFTPTALKKAFLNLPDSLVKTPAKAEMQLWSDLKMYNFKKTTIFF